ncbi:hypothetical protein KAI78_03650 [bacterium]|nr:hypothetical protein [bacterium]
MTLILTELSTHGIAMLADSAITENDEIIDREANKLQIIPNLNAGISIWGRGRINGISTDDWIADFIDNSSSISKLGDFGKKLSEKLNSLMTTGIIKELPLGFHLAGYEMVDGSSYPSFYHIHNVKELNLKPLEKYEMNSYFGCYNDCSTSQYIGEIVKKDKIYITRNGAISIYVYLMNHFYQFVSEMNSIKVKVPKTSTLDSRKDFMIFQMETIINLIEISSLKNCIGKTIKWVKISRNEIKQGEK